MKLPKLLLLSILLSGVAGAAQATVYTNAESGQINYFGTPDTTSYGETFVAPTGNLQDFTFYAVGGNAGNLVLTVASWDGAKATSPALYTSPVYAYGGGSQAIDFPDIDLGLTSGASYIAYMTIAGVLSPASGVTFEGSAGNGGLGGAFAFLNSDGVDPLTLSDSWTDDWTPSDLHFSATFGNRAAVPEPATLALVGAGLIGLRLRKRRKS